MAALRLMVQAGQGEAVKSEGAFHVTMIPGDGVGPELMHSLKEVFKAADVPVEFDEYHLSEVQNMASPEKLDERTGESRRCTYVPSIQSRKLGDGLFLQCCKEVAELYPRIQFETMIIDNCCMQLVQNPYQFDVLVMPNLYGNIIDNLAAGGWSVEPAWSRGRVTVRRTPCLRQAPRHPFAQAVGRNIANPTAMLLTATNMLRHLNLEHHSNLISDAVKRVIKQGKVRTRDMGGYSTTTDFIKAVIDNLHARHIN
ncbi:unnamed protein product [Ranitomeya imitator]|uniref:Isopropylmalate dehydrogenase-like domain-containing protein n=1 Tax=Ranitomeya imitator TaxID=111125 RepID=A0ABN9MLT0_9NEOB|nr:unnamed protein product [Ranitomeya imitator]